MIVVLASLGAAVLYGLGASVQRHGLLKAGGDESFSLKLLWRVLRQPLWLAGPIGGLVGVGLELVALAKGSLIVVTPLLSTGLLIALYADSMVSGARLSRNAWLYSTVVAFAAAGMVVSLGVGGGGKQMDPALAGGAVVTGAVCAGLWLDPRRDRRPPWLMATGAGLAFAAASALAKAAVTVPAHTPFGELLSRAFETWYMYVALAIAVAGTVILQHAYQAGPLAASLPESTVAQPIGGVVIGVLAFHESFGGDVVRSVIAGFSLALTLAALWVLARELAASSPGTEAVLATDAGHAENAPENR